MLCSKKKSLLLYRPRRLKTNPSDTNSRSWQLQKRKYFIERKVVGLGPQRNRGEKRPPDYKNGTKGNPDYIGCNIFPFAPNFSKKFRLSRLTICPDSIFARSNYFFRLHFRSEYIILRLTNSFVSILYF